MFIFKTSVMLASKFIIEVSYGVFPLLGLNNMLKAYEDKSAYALCVFSLALGPNGDPVTFLGKTPVCSLLAIELYSSFR